MTNLLVKLAFFSILVLINTIITSCNNNDTENNVSTKYCAYRKRIVLTNDRSEKQRFIDGIKLIKLNADNPLFSSSNTTRLRHQIKELLPNGVNKNDDNYDNDDEDIFESYFKFFSTVEKEDDDDEEEDDHEEAVKHELKLELDQDVDLHELIDKTIKFKLYKGLKSKCYIILDFIDSKRLEYDDEDDNEDNGDNDYIYLEWRTQEVINSIFNPGKPFKADLKQVVPDLFLDLKTPYSVNCLRGGTQMDLPPRSTMSMLNRVTLDIRDDVLEFDVSDMNNDDLFVDFILLIEQGDQKRYHIDLRIINEFNRKNVTKTDSAMSLSKQRSKRYTSFQKKYASLDAISMGLVGSGGSDASPGSSSSAQLPPQIVHKSLQSSNFNVLKTAQIAITEETVGLQTKLKIYDHVWVDYYVNASDYVKQRIQLIAPDNPILNITKPFDYETAGPVHNFQIIFTRKVDKRTVKDIKPITIKVIDVNDEPPVWIMDEPVPYTAVVERDPKPGVLVFQFIAQDPDTQSEIVYTLHSKSPNTTRFEMKDGKLFTRPGPPFQHDQYKILVSAHDAKAAGLNKFQPNGQIISPSVNGGYASAAAVSGPTNQTQEIFAELTIIVGKRPPQFYQSEYKVNISEDAPIGYNVVQMRAKSFNPDLYNKKHLRYSLQTRQGQSAEFSIYSENGTVILARKVDYETDIREYNLVVLVTEQSGWLLSSTARLNVYIEDYNDNAPQFTLSEYVRNQPIAEDLAPDTFIIQVEVQDRDSGRNGEIDWQVSNPYFYIKPFSEGDTKRAKIYNEQRLDFEIPQHMYRFDVIACDRGQPSLCASAKVSVPISNVNDEKPKFDQKVILATLDENSPPAAYVTTVQATDGDGDRIFFKLKDESGPFEINRESGIVKIKSDRKIDPREDYYNLTVYAEDDGSCCCQGSTSGSNTNTQGSRVNHKYSQTLMNTNMNCKVKTNREEATLVIKIRDINDHAPKFHDCDAYSQRAQVNEEEPVGTDVIHARAHDEDKGENGEVEYEILSTHANERNQPFKIDPRTGLIKTNMVFDREASGKFNEQYSITVKAKDRGKPHPLSDACSFRIKIVDINDHAPTFYEPEYKLSIKYDAQAGQAIQRIIASDLDSGKNAEIRYRIEQNGQYYQYFHVDESTGMISLRKEIAHTIKKPIMFNLIAEDSGEPRKSSSVSVSVVFADRDNEPPKWLPETEKRFERTVRIPEAISLNQVVETLDAESNYAPNSKLIFDFSPKPQPESFIIQQEKIPGGSNRYRGKIMVYQPLDAETQSFYQLHVRVQNAAAQPMEITGIVRVEILDSNDNIPLFTSPTYLSNVSENSPPGTYVTKVTAEDKDISAPNNVVVYTITDQEHGRKFQIDPYTGNITTRVTLDREEIKVYFIDVTACDSAMSDRPNMNTPNCRTANVRIDVSDTNDNEPFFNYTLYEATVLENAERGTPIITVQANDLDENNQQLRYIITDGNEDNVFGVRESIGEIYVLNNGKLDFETMDQYYLTLTVSDGIHNATTKIKIDLLDVNDNPPVFTESPPYEIELVEEDLNFPRTILKINATDGDIKRPNTIVFKINYNYTQNGTAFRPFNINPHTGEIILLEKLDRDYPNGRPVWSFNVIASDEGGNKGSMDSTAVVNVRLIDINDNAPVFDKPPYIGHVLENSKPGTLIMTVTANDYDDPAMGQNAILRYQIAENKKFGNLDVFSINDTSGQIYQNMKLDREQIDKYTIEVCATDGNGKRGCGQVTIYVEDANDQAPVFQSNMYTETINEDFPIGERVLVVTATDKDIGINAELSYGLKSECLVRSGTYTGNDDTDCVEGVREPKYFKVDTEREANSGFVKLAKQVNYDPPDYHRLFKLNVSVSDGQAINYTTVFINVADVNDEAPRFKEPVKNVPVYESISPLTIITNFTAEDLDTNEANRRFSYSLDRKSEGSHEFTIDQYGNLYNLESLDRETKDKYILRIFAIDEGYPPQTGIATLNLEILDVNDNFPIFAEHYNPVVMENTPPGQFLVSIRAQDLDSPENGPPFVFELPDRLNVWPSKGAPKFNMSFHVDDINGDNFAKIYSLATFDREALECGQAGASYSNGFSYQKEYDTHNRCKEYRIPILIRDSGKPPMSGINYLTVTIGDVNDNPHYPGIKRIIAYDYKGSVLRSSKPIFLGTVYAEDKDDWDAGDKEFKLLIGGGDDNNAAAAGLDGTVSGSNSGESSSDAEFVRHHIDIIESVSDLKYAESYTPGSIILKPSGSGGSILKPGQYEFKVSVRDLTKPHYDAQISTVVIVIKQVDEDMVRQSGSIRLSGVRAEKLIETRYSPNERSLLNEIQTYLARNIYKLSSDDNIKFFSIVNHKTLPDTVDIRFTAHGSPIYKAERLNGLLAHNKSNFQQWLRSLDQSIELVTVGIDECAESEKKCKESGCRSTTHYMSHQVALVNANQTALVGVMAVERAECVCKTLLGYSLMSHGLLGACTDTNYCLNGGMCVKQGSIQKCQCPRGFDGPRCQKTIRHFNSSGGFAWLNSLPQCADLVVSLEFITTNNRGLIFYNGPINSEHSIDKSNPSRYQQDFIALQMEKTRLVFQVRQGINGKLHSYTLNNFNRSLNDGSWHRVDIYKTGFKYRITIDRCIEDSSNTDKSYENSRLAHKTLTQNSVNVLVNGCEHEFQVQVHDLFINTNQYYPMQVGGVYDRSSVPKSLDYKGNFVGCIRNFKINGELVDMQVDTPNTIGFSSNSIDSCPRADKLCNPTNETNFCVNGVCDANYFKAECICKPGYRGPNCQFKTLPFDFQTPGINRRAGSYLKYRYVYQSDTRQSAYDAYLKKFTKIQLLFRTRENTTDKAQTLFQITSPNRAQYVYLEINGGRLQFRYDIGGGESSIAIAHVPVNDGRWHMVRAERYGKEASLILDDGEGVKMNYTFGLPNGAREMDVDRDSIFLGAKVVQIKVSGYEISRDYHDSCMMDVRFDDKPLPYTQQEERIYDDIAIKMETVNVKDGCASVDYCKGIFCPSNQRCVDQWRLGECQCPKGQQLNGTRCYEINDCQLCSVEGTRHCEKYNENGRLIAYENFQDQSSSSSLAVPTSSNGHFGNSFDSSSSTTTGEYPPDSWFLLYSDMIEIRDSQHKIWPVADSEGSPISGFKCVCRKGYYGSFCNAQASKRVAVLMSIEALSVIIFCLIMFIVLVLIFIVYSKSKRPTPKHYMLGVDPNDEVRETIINYVEEGCPDVDQSAYDITQLAKPVDPTSSMSSHPLNMSDGSTAIDGEFQPAVPRQKPPLQEMSYIRRDVPPVTHISGMKAHRPQNTEVIGDFINSKLREIDNDPVQPPYDSLQEYAYEGEGSMYGSTLSSLDVEPSPTTTNNNTNNNPTNRLSTFSHGRKPTAEMTSPNSQAAATTTNNDNIDAELDQIKNWGPKFNKISDIYGLKSSNDES